MSMILKHSILEQQRTRRTSHKSRHFMQEYMIHADRRQNCSEVNEVNVNSLPLTILTQMGWGSMVLVGTKGAETIP